MSDKKPDSLTLQAAADQLGVHYMTAYRYIRIGSLPATKVGKSWEVDAADLRAFQEGSHDAAPSDPDVWVDRFVSRATSGDEAGLWDVVTGALDTKLSPAEVYLNVIGPALRRIGDEWSAGRLDVAQEHRASKLVGRVIARLSPRFRTRGVKKGTIVLGSVQGDDHELGGTMVADLLRAEGFAVDDLGSNVPTSSFVHACTESDRLIGVAIASYMDSNDNQIRAAIASIASTTAVPIVVGGPGIRDEDHAQDLGATTYAATAKEAIAAFAP